MLCNIQIYLWYRTELLFLSFLKILSIVVIGTDSIEEKHRYCFFSHFSLMIDLWNKWSQYCCHPFTPTAQESSLEIICLSFLLTDDTFNVINLPNNCSHWRIMFRKGTLNTLLQLLQSNIINSAWEHCFPCSASKRITQEITLLQP